MVSASCTISLVTGASGFLGGRLAAMLAERGFSVRVLARHSSDVRHLPAACEIVRGGLSETDALRRAVHGVSHIFHCAGCSTDHAPWKVYYEANVTGVRNLLRAAAGAGGVGRFLHVSTTDVYGYPAVPCTESQPLRAVGLPYNRSKCLGEECVWEAARAGLPVTVVRPATIYGPRGKAFSEDIAAHLRRGTMAVVDGGRSRGGFSYVDNVAEAIIQAAFAPATIDRAYNLADGTGVTWRAYLDRMAAGLGCRPPWINLPGRLAFGLAGILERLPGRPVLTRHAVYLLSRDQEYPTANARRDFGFSPSVSFEEGMRRTLDAITSGNRT